jgi:hypothetical protein
MHYPHYESNKETFSRTFPGFPRLSKGNEDTKAKKTPLIRRKGESPG